MQRNHYGFTVDTEVPTTGVFSMNSLEYIHEDIDSGIDPDFVGCDCTMMCDCNEGYEQSLALIGFRYNPQIRKYEPDPEAEYSAIASLGQMGSNNLQVVASKWGIRCELCSPCYPGQGDADTPGEFLCYSVPPDVVGSDFNEELKARIFKLA